MAHLRLLLVALVSLPLGCSSPAQIIGGDLVDLGIDDGTVRLLLIGDSGTFEADGGPCEPATTASPIPGPCRDELIASLDREDADALLVLGDLVYEAGPRCVEDELTSTARAELDVLLGDLAHATGIPVLPVLGNHDVAQSVRGNAATERCYLLYAAETDGVFLPERNYAVNAGPLRIVALDTNRPLSGALAAELAADRDTLSGPWTAYAGHHVWKTYFDKQGENHGPRFSEALGEAPDLWLNGHAHLLQFGVYDGVAAVTSGASGKLRARQGCEGASCADWEGLEFARSQYGYAVLDVSEDAARVTFRDVAGDPLFAWERSRDDPQGVAIPNP